MVESHLAAGSLQHLSVADRLFHLCEHADLARDGHREFFVGQLDCGEGRATVTGAQTLHSRGNIFFISSLDLN